MPRVFTGDVFVASRLGRGLRARFRAHTSLEPLRRGLDRHLVGGVGRSRSPRGCGRCGSWLVERGGHARGHRAVLSSSTGVGRGKVGAIGPTPVQIVSFATMNLTGLGLSTVAVHSVAVLATQHHLSRLVRTGAVEGVNIAAWGALWVVQFLVLDRYVFRPRTLPRCLRAHRWRGQPMRSTANTSRSAEAAARRTRVVLRACAGGRALAAGRARWCAWQRRSWRSRARSRPFACRAAPDRRPARRSS